MKIIVSENQYNKLIEQNLISYSPEKIDAFVLEGGKHLNNYLKLKNTYYNQLLHLTVGMVQDNLTEIKVMVEKINSEEKKAEELSNKYFDIVDLYDFMDYPPNVKKLEEIYQKLEEVQYDLGAIADVYEALFDSVKHLPKQDLPNEDNILKLT